MILTARQAEDKVCPMMSREGAKIKCESESCAMWRWVNMDLLVSTDTTEDIKAGYCGAAGKPQVYRLEEF